MPVVITDALVDKPWFAPMAEATDTCCQGVYDRLKAKYEPLRAAERAAGKQDENCNPYRDWCADGVQIVQDRECQEIARLPSVAHIPRPFVHPDSLSGPEEVYEGMLKAYILTAQQSETFGAKFHYDTSCHSTFSMQMKGLKTWHLYAPWDLPANNTKYHSHFLAELKPGDILYVPGAWFHTTSIDSPAKSVASNHYIRDFPTYGELIHDHSLWPSPYGFEQCAGGPEGWRKMSKKWEATYAAQRPAKDEL